MGDYVRWTGLWTLHGSLYGLGFRSLPGHKTIGFRCGVDAGEGSDQLALKDARSAASGSSEAEYVALSEVVKEVLFLRQVREFLEPSMRVGAVNVFEDNEGAIKLATNKHASRRSKHIDVKHHLVRGASDARKVRVAYVRSEDQHADLLTKPQTSKSSASTRSLS